MKRNRERGYLVISPAMQRWLKANGHAQLVEQLRAVKVRYEAVVPRGYSAMPREKLLHLARLYKARLDAIEMLSPKEEQKPVSINGRQRKQRGRRGSRALR